MTSTLSGGAAFFAAVRPMYGGKLAQTQVDGINAIMDAWNLYGEADDRKLAYILATAYHETGRTMQPVREAFGKSDTDTKAKLTKAWKAGKLKVRKDYWSGGYFGRGLVQLTHEANYAKAGAALLLDLVGNPSLALDLVNASLILVKGMMEGWFTSKKLSDYIDVNAADYKGARRVVNGTARAADIADYAETFEAAIRAARHVDPVPVPEASPEPEPAPPVNGNGSTSHGPAETPPETSPPNAEPSLDNGVNWGRVASLAGVLAILGALGWAAFKVLL